MTFIKYIVITILFGFSVSQLAFAQLSGVKIGIDPGHGGTDPGALGFNGAATPDEADIVLTVGKELQKKFKNLGATVVMTRTTDVYQTLSYRANLMNQQNPDAYVSIHENSFTSSSAHGTETWTDRLAGSNSKSLAAKIQTRMVADMGFRDRGTKNMGLTAVRVKASIPAALTEGCFLSNPTEWNYITKNSNQICHANAIKNGVLDYLGYSNLVDLNCTTNNPPITNSDNVAPLGSLFEFTTELSNSYAATKAFDGTTSTRWNSNGADNFNYFIVELDRDYAVNKFVVKHASTAGLSSNLNTQEYRIIYWTGFEWTKIIDYTNSAKQGTTSHNVSIPITKWVALVVDNPTFTSDKYARIPEFEIHGKPVNARLSSNNHAPEMPNFNTNIGLNASVHAHPNVVTNGIVQFVMDKVNDEQASIFIKNAAGQIVKHISTSNGNTALQVDLSNLSKGIYFYHLQTGNHTISEVKKLLIQ